MSPWTFKAWSQVVAKSGRPILVGPWREEIGSECLYWLPWVSHWLHTYGIDRGRVVALSRGGAAHWYGVGKQIELYDYWPAEMVRLEALKDATETGTVKPSRETPLERALAQTIALRLGLRRYHTLHPRLMYADIRAWMQDAMSLKDVVARLRFQALPTPHLPLTVALPNDYLCVRFYARHTWPLTEEIKEYCGQLVGHLAKHTPVVVIGSSLHHDDHLDMNFSGPNITSLVDAFPQRENLALQSAVIAKSRGFVGTYGGTMQLAVRLHKPSVGFYTRFAGTAFGHKALTEWLAIQQQTPIFIGTPQQADFIRSVVSVPLDLPQPVGSSSGVMA